ncbi:MAG: helix-turn-helix transcriptional regulator [Alphaproteobacteria bacterium]
MAHPVDSHVGQKLRQRRWLMGMTQQELGSAVGIRFQQIQKYESGANRVSASRLWDISQVLEVPVAYFFDGLGTTEDEEDSFQGAMAHGDTPVNGTPMNGTRVNGNAMNGAHNDNDMPSDILGRRETADLVRAYYTIPESKRRQFLELAKTMGDAG